MRSESQRQDYEGRRAVVQARGHRLIRATHAKTLEITCDSTVTARATCIIGVAAEFDAAAVGLLRGPLRITVEAAGRRTSGYAVANPGFEAGHRLVVRRSDLGDPETLAVRSTLTANDLDRTAAAALADPHERVTLTLTEAAPRRPLVLVGMRGMPSPPGRLGLQWRHADAVVDFAGSKRGSGNASDALRQGGTVTALLSGSLDRAPEAAVAWLADAARLHARFAVMPASATSPADASQPAPVLLAAGLADTPVLWLGRVSRRFVRREEIAVLLHAPPVPVVLTVPVADAAAVLGPLSAAAPGRQVAVQADPLDVGVAVDWTSADQAVAAIEAFPGSEAVTVLPAEVHEGYSIDLGMAVRALTAAGVPARTLSEALAPLGVGRRRIYRELTRPRVDPAVG